MTPFVHEFYVNIRNGAAYERGKKPVSQGDALADKLVIHLQDCGTDVDMTGLGVMAKAIRYDGQTVPLMGETVDGAAVVVLDASCYAVPGELRVTVSVTSGEMIQSVLSLVLNVETSETGIIVDNGVISDLSEILSAIADMRAATEDARTAAAAANEAREGIRGEIARVEDTCVEGKYRPELVIGLWSSSNGSVVTANHSKRIRVAQPIRGVNGMEARIIQTSDATAGSSYRVAVIYVNDATGEITVGSWKTQPTPMESGTTYYITIRDNNGIATAEQMAADLAAGNVYIEVVVLGRESLEADLERLNFGEIMVRSVAHRGDAISAPENTMAAYRAAVKNGYRYMESDVHFTADGIPVMLHDDTIDRTSNGTGNVADYTLAQLKELDFGSWFGETFVGEQIPTFEEMLGFCRATGIIPFIELKGQTQTQVELLVDYVDRYGLLDKVHWVSFDRECLGYVHGVNPDANLCHVQWSTSAATAAVVAGWKTGKNEVGIMPYKNATAETAEICRAAGVYMMAGPVTTAADVLAAPAYATWFTVDGVDAARVLYDNAMGV